MISDVISFSTELSDSGNNLRLKKKNKEKSVNVRLIEIWIVKINHNLCISDHQFKLNRFSCAFLL